MARPTKKAALAVAQDKAAPFLFDESQVPMLPEVLTAVKEARYKHTGARLLDNEAKALRLVELLMMGSGLRKISREMSISIHTVRAAREVLVARGEMATYKERVVRRFEEIVELGSLKYLEALEEGKVPPGQIPVGIGIISDKRALALGEPTSIGGTAPAAGQVDDLSVEKLNRYFAALKQAAPIDVHSTVKEEKTQ